MSKIWLHKASGGYNVDALEVVLPEISAREVRKIRLFEDVHAASTPLSAGQKKRKANNTRKKELKNWADSKIIEKVSPYIPILIEKV